MKRSARLAAAAIAASLAVGVAGPTIAAPAHAKPTNGHHAVKAAKATKTAKVSDRDKRHVLRDIANLDSRLIRVVKATRTAHLTVEDREIVVANVADDRATLADLATTVKEADASTDLKQVRRDLKQVRTTNYTEAINVLRGAARAADESAVLREQVEFDSPEAALLDEADSLIEAAILGAYDVNAFSVKDDVREAKASLSQAKDLLDQVEEAIANYDTDGDDTGDDTSTGGDTDTGTDTGTDTDTGTGTGTGTGGETGV